MNESQPLFKSDAPVTHGTQSPYLRSPGAWFPLGTPGPYPAPAQAATLCSEPAAAACLVQILHSPSKPSVTLTPKQPEC